MKKIGGDTMQEFYDKHKAAIQDFFILSVSILLCFLFFRYLFSILLPFLVGWLLSLCFRPVAERLERHHIPRWISALLCLMALLGIFSLFVALIGNRIWAQAESFIRLLPYYIEILKNAVDNFLLKLDELFAIFPDFIHNAAIQVRENISSLLFSLVKFTGSSSLNSVPNFLLGLLIALLSSYFFTKDAKQIHTFYENHIQTLLGNSVAHTKQELKNSIWGYIKTQLILMGYTFLITFIGLLLFRSPFTLLLSIVIAVIDALPFFGSGFILWPGAVIHFLMGNPKLALGYLIIYVAVQIMRQVMQPKILGTQIGLHPLLTLFAMYFGYKCIGFWGFILGPMIAVLLQAYFKNRHTEQKEV